LVRARRLERTRSDLRRLQSQAGRLKRRTLIERATRILADHKTSQYIGYLAGDGGFSFWLERAHYRRRRRHDGSFHPVDQCRRAQARGETPRGAKRIGVQIFQTRNRTEARTPQMPYQQRPRG
jgi:hypothetical protein